MSDTPKTYGLKHNATRAARAAGLDLSTLDFYQADNGGWTWRVAAEAVEAAAIAEQRAADAAAFDGPADDLQRDPIEDAASEAAEAVLEAGGDVDAASEAAVAAAEPLLDSREDAYARETGQHAAHDPDRPVQIMGEDGSDYGPARLSSAREMAATFAKDDGITVELQEIGSGEVIERFDPPSEERPWASAQDYREGDDESGQEASAPVPAGWDSVEGGAEEDDGRPNYEGTAFANNDAPDERAGMPPRDADEDQGSEDDAWPGGLATQAEGPRDAVALQVLIGRDAEARTDEALIEAARSQAFIFDQSENPKVAWLLREMANRLEAGSVPQAKAPRAPRAPAAPRQPRTPRKERDWLVKTIITSPANQHVQKFIDRIFEQRGNLEGLLAIKPFSRASTYYAYAGKHLDALIEEARAQQAAAEGGAPAPAEADAA